MVISRSSIPQQIMKPGRKRVKNLNKEEGVGNMENKKDWFYESG